MTRADLTRRRLIGGLAAACAAGAVRAEAQGAARPWAGSTIPYALPSGHPHALAIFNAVKEINAKTNIHLVGRPASALEGAPHLRFTMGEPVRDAGAVETPVPRDLDALGALLRALDAPIEAAGSACPGAEAGALSIGPFVIAWREEERWTLDARAGFGAPEYLDAAAVAAINARYPTRSLEKPVAPPLGRIRSTALWNDHGGVHLRAGESHIAGYRADAARLDPRRRWEPVSAGAGEWLLYNRDADAFLSAWARPLRARGGDDPAADPLLRWRFAPRFNYFLIHNAETDRVLDAGRRHTRAARRGEDVGNPWLRWTFDAVDRL